jgi:SAM-dependent methyltransferase
MPIQLACLLAPQRSTQYANLVAHLALPELQISPLGAWIEHAELRHLGDLPFLVITLREGLSFTHLDCLSQLVMTHGYFWLEEAIGDRTGPWLRPLETPSRSVLPEALLYTRRYKGKTNEELTRFLINAARFVSDFVWTSPPLDILDPLCGGGTTLFAALIAGHNAYGIDQARGGVESTATFLHGFLSEAGISHWVREERLRNLGRRWTFAIESSRGRLTCALAHGDTADAAALFPGLRPHLIVGDLPYGIQHKGAAIELLARSLPVWTSLLRPGGGLCLAWDATRLPRSEMLATARKTTSELEFLDGPPWDTLGHAVDRVIKRREILAARRK